MKTRGDDRIADSVRRFEEKFRFLLPPICCGFTEERPPNGLSPGQGEWACMLSFLDRVAKGETLCLSSDNAGCSGAACYLGYEIPRSGAGVFLAEKERFKKTVDLGRAFYGEIQAPPAGARFFVMERADKLREGFVPEVVTVWVNAESLAELVTLANYDRPTNDNVMIPFASGCQSIWTIPCKEKDRELSKCVVGGMDPAARIHLPPDVVSFSMPANRFVEMADNIAGSFLSSPHKNNEG